jgi:DNA-directed RNA polymerase subunit beta'
MIVKAGSSVKSGDIIAESKDKKAVITAPFDGVVEPAGEDEIVIAGHVTPPVKYEIPGYQQLVVKAGAELEAGDQLTIGSLNLQDLMKHKGVEATQRYIINEILSIYAAQGQNVASKHLEIIVNQMFSRVQVDEPGDSAFVFGDIVSKASVVDANRALADAGKSLIKYTQLLLGVTKVSIFSDSFLSAASFQDTTRVLTNSAILGRVDNLRGLKENVIIGRKIPVGTGVAALPTDVDDEVLDISDDLTNDIEQDIANGTVDFGE